METEGCSEWAIMVRGQWEREGFRERQWQCDAKLRQASCTLGREFVSFSRVRVNVGNREGDR